jgi:hypothetical protein
MNYAMIDADGIVMGVSQLSGAVDKPDMIEIAEYDTTLIGKKWTGEEFTEVVIEPSDEQVIENLIAAEQVEIRRQEAIDALISRGVLTADGELAL